LAFWDTCKRGLTRLREALDSRFALYQQSKLATHKYL
jgi:hypothetical protein